MFFNIPVRSRRFDEKDRAILDVLLKQYEFLREEITRCIYLEHTAILGLYTSLGIIGSVLVKERTTVLEFDIFELTFFLSALVFAQVFINGFGSLFSFIIFLFLLLYFSRFFSFMII